MAVFAGVGPTSSVKPSAPQSSSSGTARLMAVLAAKQMEAGRIIAMSRHKSRQDLALEYGATDIVSERGDEGIARIKEMTENVGADAVLAARMRAAWLDDRLVGSPCLQDHPSDSAMIKGL